MERLGAVITMLDYALCSKRRKHIAGGILMSVSLLFGGLAITVMTLKEEEENYEQIE
jgi:hypothetical protein